MQAVARAHPLIRPYRLKWLNCLIIHETLNSVPRVNQRISAFARPLFPLEPFYFPILATFLFSQQRFRHNTQQFILIITVIFPEHNSAKLLINNVIAF